MRRGLAFARQGRFGAHGGCSRPGNEDAAFLSLSTLWLAASA